MNRILEEDLDQIIADNIAWDKLKNSAVLITGASGMVGSYMMYVLIRLNDIYNYNIRIIAMVRNEQKLPEEIRNREDVQVFVGDVTNPIEIEGDVTYIIHAASPASPLIMQNKPVETIAANTIGTFHTLSLAKEKNAAGYLFISSREIYGQPEEGQEFFYEDTYGFVDQLNPRSCYSEGKKAAETMCVCFKDEYRLNTKIARLAHTYGPGMSIYDGRVQADFLKNDTDILRGDYVRISRPAGQLPLFRQIIFPPERPDHQGEIHPQADLRQVRPAQDSLYAFPDTVGKNVQDFSGKLCFLHWFSSFLPGMPSFYICHTASGNRRFSARTAPHNLSSAGTRISYALYI